MRSSIRVLFHPAKQRERVKIHNTPLYELNNHHINFSPGNLATAQQHVATIINNGNGQYKIMNHNTLTISRELKVRRDMKIRRP